MKISAEQYDRMVEEIRSEFADPDTSNMFTVPMLEKALGISRGQVRTKLDKKLKRGEIEFVMNYKNINYYRFVGKNGNSEG